MKSKVKHVMLVAAIALLSSCKPFVPPEYIQPDDMEDLIYDYHLAQGIASQQDGNQDYNRELTFELVLKKHGLTQAQFDSSLVYYYTRADRFQEIYKHVQERLDTEAEKYGAATNDVRITANSLSGDTTDVWKGNRALMLINDRPYHLYQFSQKADTSYRAGDSFMMSLNSTWLMQQGNRQASIYLAITYENDSTVKQYSTISISGPTTLRVPYCKERVKEIKGFMMCGMRPNNDNSSNLCLLFMNDIQLIRFRNKLSDTPAELHQPAETMASPKDEPAQFDTLRKPMRQMGNRPLTIGEIQQMRRLENKNVKPNSK
ncbi:DUF4296 domain-containing protein [Prevotella sp. MA2016]|uniref:DUF4296 domain-containing protein n=1 Tax=Prevotella sp. MA2016 TaxID=1408310 RepID=UPI0012DC80CB|nr:DUF4296 domain-containing protein [Prevotella sp. MA2016]